MTTQSNLRVFSNDQPCRRCSDCVGCDHHWLFVSFPPFDTDDPEFRQDVQDWWERTGHDESVCPAFWSCKHCSAWTPDDPDEVDDELNDSELPNGSPLKDWRVGPPSGTGLPDSQKQYNGKPYQEYSTVEATKPDGYKQLVCHVYQVGEVGSPEALAIQLKHARLIAAANELHDALAGIIFKASDLLLEHGWIHEVESAVAALQKADSE